MVENLRRALHQRWFQGALCVWALVGLVALGAPVLDYSSTWVSMALGAGGIASSLFVFRGLVDQFGTFSEHEERRLTVTPPELRLEGRSTLVFGCVVFLHVVTRLQTWCPTGPPTIGQLTQLLTPVTLLKPANALQRHNT